MSAGTMSQRDHCACPRRPSRRAAQKIAAPRTAAARAIVTSIALAPGATRAMPTPRPATPKTITARPSRACRFTRRAVAGRNASRRSPQQEQVLVRVSARSFGDELHLFEPTRHEPLAHPRRGMERRAAVRPRNLRPADDELTAREPCAFLVVEPLEIPLAVRR